MEEIKIDIMPTVITMTDIENHLKDYCALKDIKDMCKETQMRWTAALLYIYEQCFKPNNETVRYNNKNSILNYKDVKQLSDVADIYIRLCYENNKEVSIDGYSKITGIHKQTLYNWEHKEYRYIKYINISTGEEIEDINEWKLNNRGEYKEELSTAHFDFIQKIRNEEEESTYQRASDVRGNQTIFLAKLNKRNGWNMPGIGRQESKKEQSKSLEEIQQEYGALPEKPPELPQNLD